MSPELEWELYKRLAGELDSMVLAKCAIDAFRPLLADLEAEALSARAEALEAAAGIAEAHGHMPPFDDTKEIDRIASYSTKTCEMIADAIRALKENP